MIGVIPTVAFSTSFCKPGRAAVGVLRSRAAGLNKTLLHHWIIKRFP
jgi:hypothetical protein